MKWPTYPKYKDSGVDWVGEVPEGWAINRLKFLCTIQTGNKDTVDALDEGQYPFFVRSPQIEKINSFSYDGEAVLTAGDGVGVGKVYHYFIGKFDFHQRVYMMCDFQNISGRFFYFYLVSMFHKVALEGGAKSTVDSLRMPLFLNFQLTIPSESEQRIIVEFCDRQTERIDSLIAEQEKLVSLLQEKRQAVISHAVTKGLNPDAPMKDSGVEWLGEVPSGWSVVGITKHLQSVVDYRGRTPEKIDSGILLITAKNITDGKIDYQASEEFISFDEYEKTMTRGKPEYGDVLLTTEAPLGQVANVDNTNIALAQRIIKLSGKHDILNNYYLKYWIMSTYCQYDFSSHATGSTAQGIKGSKLGQILICIPPIDEQLSIVEHIDVTIKAIDSLIGKAETMNEILKERRTALISAAVTGKIDVRGLTASEPA